MQAEESGIVERENNHESSLQKLYVCSYGPTIRLWYK